MSFLNGIKEVNKLRWIKKEYSFFEELSWTVHSKGISTGELYPNVINKLNDELRESGSKERYSVDFGDKED